MFPETANWLTPADEYVLIPTNLHSKNLTVHKNHSRGYQRGHLIFVLATIVPLISVLSHIIPYAYISPVYINDL